MKLRTRLIAAFFVLAVVPLTAIVTYSYLTSLAAFRRAVEDETAQQADELNQRMAAVREDLDRTIGRASRMRFAAVAPSDTEADEAGILERLRSDMGEVAPLVEAYEFVPAPVGEKAAEGDVPGDGVLVLFDTAPEPEALPVPVVLAVPPSPPTLRKHHELEKLVQRLVEEGTRSAVEALADEADTLADEIEAAVEADAEAEEEHALRSELVATLTAEGMMLVAQAIRDPDGVEEYLGERGREVVDGLVAAIPAAVRLTDVEMEELRQRRTRAEELLGRRYRYQVLRGERVVGHVHAQVRGPEVLQMVLGHARRVEGEIPFAVDRDGELYTSSGDDKERLEGLVGDGADQALHEVSGDWIVVRSEDPGSGLTFGIARPVGTGLQEIRRTAVGNLALGLLLVGVAGFGILPLSGRMTRNVKGLTAAAGALADGDLSVRVPVRSRDELGRLADAFNRMAADLELNQQRLLEEERLRQAQDVERRLLEAENERKSDELEAARQFQMSLLPSRLPELAQAELAAVMRPATEVGGDYYDFRVNDGGSLTVAIGDATGHGAAAATMVTIAKSLFSASGDRAPAEFLAEAARIVRSMRLGRMYMALLLARLDGRRLQVSAAGMPPILVHRAADGQVDEVLVPGAPLGALDDPTYQQVEVDLESGDTVILMSDGFPELVDPDGEPLGFDRSRQEFAEAAAGSPADVIEAMQAAAERWRGSRPQDDDITFVVLRVPHG